MGDGVSWRGAPPPQLQLRAARRGVAGSPAYGCRSPPVWWPGSTARHPRLRGGGGPTESASPAYGRTCPLHNKHELAPDLVRRVRIGVGPPPRRVWWRAEQLVRSVAGQRGSVPVDCVSRSMVPSRREEHAVYESI